MNKTELNDALLSATTPEQTKLLIDAGADVNAKDFCGRTALTFAKTSEQAKLLSNATKKVRTEIKPIKSLIKSIKMKNSQKLR